MAVSFCPFIPVQLIGAVGAVIGFQLARQARREDYRRELACSIGTVASIAGVVLCLLTPACPNEVNGRETPITTRGIVAMQGGAASATSSICSSFLSAPASTSAIR